MKIPLTWKDITIGEYQEICNIDDTLSATDQKIEQLSILTNTDSQQIKSLLLVELFKMIEMTKFVDTTAVDSFVLDTFTFKDVEYAVMKDFDRLTGYEWFDVENWKTDPINNMHNFAALAYRPIIGKDNEGNIITHEYKDDKYFSMRAESFKDLPITHINGFFLRCALFQIEYIQNMGHSLTESEKGKSKTKTRKKTGKKQATRTRITNNNKKNSKGTTCGTTSSRASLKGTRTKSKT